MHMNFNTELILSYVTDPNIIIRFLVLYVFVIWISVVVWVIKDITHRSDNFLLQVVCVVTVLIFTPLGIFIYLLMRPQNTLFERLYEREFRSFTQEQEQADHEVAEIIRKELRKNNAKKKKKK